MPMDCDDNETSRHNLQLAGEGRSRSSSALRPYDFPKFDFDDSLQGHLRFDSLVETEVFLGIQSQEDNQWIEDFSQGSNGMEFNPTPADSCSISRRNNVWSEATSSESVEMLLKSVGQEEMMPGAPFIPESDVTNDQGTLSRYGESSNKHKESNDAYIANAETTLPLDEVLKDYSDSRRHSVGQLEDALSLQAKDDSASGNSSNFNQNALCGNGGTSVNEGKHSCQDECAVENLETKASLEKATNIVAGGDSLSFSGITENVNSNVQVLSPSKASEHVTSIVSHESCGLDGQENNVFIKTSLEETAILEEKTCASVQICTGSSSFGSVPESGRDSQEADPDSVRELKSSEGDDKNTLLTTSIQNMRQEEVLATRNEVDEPCDNCQGVSSIDDITQHSTELGGLNPGHCSSTQQNMDPAVQLSHKQDNAHVEDVSANPLKNKSMSEVPLLSMKDNEVLLETGDSKDINNNGSSSDMGMLSSSVVKKDSINLEGSCEDSIVTGKESGTNLHAHDSNLFAHDNDISVQVILENSVLRQADSKAEGDICKSEEADTEISNDLRNVDSENVGTPKDDQRTQSLEVGEVVEGNIPELQPQDCEVLESGGLDDHPEFGQRELVAIESLHLDNDSEDGGMKKVPDENLGTEVENASKVEDIVANDSVRIPLSELSAKSQQPVEKTNVLCSNEISLVEAMNSSYSDHPQSHSSCKQSSIKKSVDADFLSGGHHEKAVTKEEEKGSLQTPEIDKASCGSPTIISSSEPLLTEKESQEEFRGYQVAYESVKDVKPISEDQKRKDLQGDDSSFTFKVNALPETTHNEPANNWSPISDLGKGKIVGETAPSPKAKTERTASKKAPRQNARVSDGESGPGTAKGTSERKGRRGVGKGTAKENVKKGNQAKSFQENVTGKVEKISNILSSTPISSPHVQYGQMQPHGNIDTNKKVSAAAAVPTSSLPDLNSSALNSSTSQQGPFRQPFSDLQQVQLRAQIFVYGSLIQGTAPDEAYMVSAFGSSDGGRSTWEPIWRVAAERVRSQKSSSAACETPRSQSGARTSDALKQGSHSSKAITTPTPLSRPSSKDTPAAVLNPIIPLSSPLWNISTPSRDSMTSNSLHKGPMDFQPLHSSYQTPIRNFVGHTSWSPPTGFPGTWLASPQTASFSSSVRFHPVTITETVKSTSIKDTSAVLASNVKHMTSSPDVHTVIPSPVLGEGFPLHDSKKVSTAELHSVDTKPRKRKKNPFDSQVSLVSEAHTEPVVVSDVTNVLPSPIGESTSACRVSEVTNLIKPIADTERVSSVVRTKKPDSDAEKAVACSEESLIKVAEAKGQAEDAADLATAAVTHCEDLWSQLAKRRESGLTSETEAKLASAAVAIAAAASVAKAAAATAKVACDAALQAKLMADEAFLSSKTSGVQDIGNITPASILKSNNATNQPSSILVAAKEAAKRRVEAASAASKQAENLDAIVKAAELAAAAVSQAGKIVAMGEPLPLNELMEAGPEGYWKLHQSPAVLAEKVRDGNIEQSGAVSLGKVVDMSANVPVEDSVKNGGSRSVSVNDVHLPEGPVDSVDVCMNLSDDIKGSQPTDDDLGTGANQKASDPSKSGRLASEADVSDKSTNFKNERDEFATHAGDGVKKGSLVEVFKPGNGLKSAWYTANVLNLEDGKAYVCYNDVMSEEGSGQFQEWIPLESEDGKAPIIRAAHPLSLQYQQTRKRRRATLGDYVWCVGDKVDVWIDDCWWEGVVTEKNEKDETTLKVHITAQGETSMVRAWNLRRSRSWINGKWAEWSPSSRGNASEQSDTPQEKRQKLGTPLLASKAKDKESNKAVLAPGKPEESKFLNLSTSDRTFDIGKTTNDDNKRAARRPLRTNQQKEGSRVIFGVPKPTGKKRKFMEVSKHFPANKSDKGREVNDPVKFTKYLIPQGAASRSSKVPSRNDPKEKRPSVESRPRVLSTRKAHRTLPQRGNLMSSSAKDSEKPVNHGTEDSVDHDENTSEKSKDHGSNLYEEASEAPLSSLLSHSLSNASKKTSSSHTRSDRLNRGNVVPSSGKLSKIEEDKAYSTSTSKSVLDTSEPRRSNRRIQPTHRLLEGLQSSMVIPKMPSVSNDKVRRNLPARGK